MHLHLSAAVQQHLQPENWAVQAGANDGQQSEGQESHCLNIAGNPQVSAAETAWDQQVP